MSDPARDLVHVAVQRTLLEPLWFLQHVLRSDPSRVAPWQIDATEAIFDVRRKAMGLPTKVNHEGKQRITIRAGHGPGKTHWLAAVAHTWNFTTYALVAVTAPKQDQLRTRFFYRYKRLLAGAAPWYRSMVTADNLKASLCGDETWGIQGETASEPENLAGYHDTPQLFLVDEASGRRMDPMFPVIEGALTTPGSVCVEIGNPTRDEGEFYQHHSRADLADLYFRIHVHPEQAPGLISKEWIRNMRIKYGEKSPIFQVRVLGNFAAMDRHQLVNMTWLEEAREDDRREDGSIPRLRVSVDVADGGADSSVFTVAKHFDSFILFLKQVKENFPPAESPIRCADLAEELFKQYGGNPERGDDVVVDSIGVGAGTAGTLIDRNYNVVTFKGGAAVENSGYRNSRAAGYISLRDAHRDHRIVYAENFTDDWDEYVGQICSIRSRPGNERDEDVETKEMHFKHSRKSPDRADSSMMQFTDKSPTIGSSSGHAPLPVGGSAFGGMVHV